MRFVHILLGFLIACCVSAVLAATGSNGVVATVHPIASDEAVRAMREGGNAIDAAVVAALTLGVVDGHNSGIGGGCFMLVRRANGEVVAIDGREKAPVKAHRDMFVRDGRADPKLSQNGPLAPGVPGSLAAYDYAVKQFGKRTLKRHLIAAAAHAEKGFALDATYAGRLAGTVEELRGFGTPFLKADGTAYKRGEVLRLPDLARTYHAIAENGIEWFYKGEFSQAVERWMQHHGGLLSAKDFRDYAIQLREPLRTSYRGYEIVGFPPPSSGGVHVAQILNILETFELSKFKPGSAEFVHLVSEAMKAAFADRAHWLGDSDFVRVPRGLVSKDYAAQLAKNISFERTTSVPRHGNPPGEDIFKKHTTHFSTADSEGNWVACTATINTSFGSKVVIPGTGVVLNNQMDDFAIQPGVKNYFGLIGAEANAVAAGKRPLSSMSPTMVLKAGKPIISLGAAGGPTIISQTLLTIIYMIDFGMSLEEALEAPRFHHQWVPDELRIERKVGPDAIVRLKQLGHNVILVDSMGAAQAVAMQGSILVGADDPRVEGKALGY
jgi:gamma-glutamyltranspeptidase / glutathione hydrolase